MMNIDSHKWEDKLLKQCGGDTLAEKLAKEPVEGGTVLGNISDYYVKRYGFNPGTAQLYLKLVRTHFFSQNVKSCLLLAIIQQHWYP